MTDEAIIQEAVSPRELYALRKSADMTQTEMADELGITLRGYQKLESGDSPLKPMHIKAAQFVMIERMAAGKISEDAQIQKLVAVAHKSIMGNEILKQLFE